MMYDSQYTSETKVFAVENKEGICPACRRKETYLHYM